jgi:hypothetical protein
VHTATQGPCLGFCSCIFCWHAAHAGGAVNVAHLAMSNSGGACAAAMAGCCVGGAEVGVAISHTSPRCARHKLGLYRAAAPLEPCLET